MTETGVLMGLPTSSGTSALGAPIAVLCILFTGCLMVLVVCLKQQRGSDTQSRPPCPREWLWAWGFVFVINLPIPLIFGFDVTKGGGAFGMLAGVGVVWLIGHFAMARLNAIRGPLITGGGCVAVSQGMPIAQFVAGLLAIDVVTGYGNIDVKSVAGGFAVTLLTAALLAVVALVIGFTLHAGVWVFEGRIARNQN